MQRILIALMIISMVLSTAGCAKLVSSESKDVEVKIVDTYYRGAYSTPMRIGKTSHMQFHPAKYKIIVSYNGSEYTISGSETYNEFKDSIGEVVNATLTIKKYDNNKVYNNISDLKR